MPYELLVAEEFWKLLEKTRDRALGERIVKALRKLRDAPRERGRMLVGAEHPVHGRIYRLRVGKHRVLYCIDEQEAKVYVLTFALRDRAYDDL